jgi:hypothetical protein
LDGVLLFFSFTSRKDRPVTPTAYRFVAALKVERKITQAAIFEQEGNKQFRSYLNLLIRPRGRGWEHFEPCLPRAKWHTDWLWRICKRNGLKKDALDEAGDQHRAGDPLTVNGKVVLSENYVIFSRSASIMAENPPLVATYRGGNGPEIWETDDRSAAIKGATFGNSNRALRTGNPSQPHRHFRWSVDNDSWVNSLRNAL